MERPSSCLNSAAASTVLPIPPFAYSFSRAECLFRRLRPAAQSDKVIECTPEEVLYPIPPTQRVPSHSAVVQSKWASPSANIAQKLKPTVDSRYWARQKPAP